MTTLPEPTVAAGHAFFFGLGYTALRLARRLRAAGWTVSGTVRTPEKAQAITATEGIAAHVMTEHLAIGDTARAFDGITHVIDSIPPTEAGDIALIHHLKDLRAAPELRWIGYLSTPAVYGDRGGGIARESDPPTPGSARGRRRAAAERAWVEGFDAGRATVQVFRVAGIYGPGPKRSPLAALRDGSARIIDKPGQLFNRIHVDDIGSILMASMARPRDGAVYNVADDEACPSGDPVRFAAGLLGVDPPEPVAFETADLSPMARSFYAECKRLETVLLVGELGVTLSYPSYREGLAAIAAGDRV